MVRSTELWLSKMVQSHSNSEHRSLAKIALFAELPQETLERIGRRCSWRRYRPGELIIDYLDLSDEVYYIATGEVRVTIYSIEGKAVSFPDLGPGDSFGEWAAIDRQPRSASVEARTSCHIACMAGVEFRTLLGTEPNFTDAILKQFVLKLRELTSRVHEFSTLCVRNRIQAEVLRLARHVTPEGNVARIDRPPTHAEIASRISTHREAVSRELSRLYEIGIIDHERYERALLVTDIDRLTKIVREAKGD